MYALAGAVPMPAYRRFVFNAGLFVAVAAVGMFGVFLPLVMLLFPVQPETGALRLSLFPAAC